MLRVRETFARDSAIERQLVARKIVAGGMPNTRSKFERCVAALVDHPSIEPIARARIFDLMQRKLLTRDDAFELHAVNDSALDALESADTFEQQNRSEVEPMIGALAIGASIHISPKCRSPRTPNRASLATTVVARRGVPTPWDQLGSGATLHQFEAMCFGGGKAFFEYREGASFAHYLMQNLVHYLGLMDERNIERALAGNDSWQAKLALRLYRSGTDTELATRAFYEPRVMTASGQIYDTSFVPNFDVQSLVPLRPIELKPDARQHLAYYASLDVTTEQLADARFLEIFAVFPFKLGYYVCSRTGRIVRLAVPQTQIRESTHQQLRALCDEHLLRANESAGEDLGSLMRLEYDDLVSGAVYSSTIDELAVHLLLLHRMTTFEQNLCRGSDPMIRVDGVNVRIPSPDQVLYWHEFPCSSVSNETRALLPLSTLEAHELPESCQHQAQTEIQLVRDIADSCFSRMGAVVMCSEHRLTECLMHDVFRALTSDAEKFVFYTLVLQDYNSPMMQRARDALFAESTTQPLRQMFGQHTIVAHHRSARCCESVGNEDSTFELVDSTVQCGDASPWRAFDLYEFEDSELRQLVELESTKDAANLLTDWQLAGFAAIR